MIQKRVKGEPVQFPSPGEWVGDGSWWRSFLKLKVTKRKRRKQTIGGNITFFVWGFVCIYLSGGLETLALSVSFLPFIPTMERIRLPKFLWIPTVLWLLLNWNLEPTSCVLPMAGNTPLVAKQEYHALIAFRILQWQGWQNTRHGGLNQCMNQSLWFGCTSIFFGTHQNINRIRNSILFHLKTAILSRWFSAKALGESRCSGHPVGWGAPRFRHKWPSQVGPQYGPQGWTPM